MRSKSFLILLFFIGCQQLEAQNTELHRLASEVKVDLVENILPFWSDNMVDQQNGGFYGRMDGNNQEVLGNKRIISEVEKKVIPIVGAAMEGLQPDGSLVNEKDIASGQINTNRDWWPQAETVVGLVNAFEITGNSEYLNKAIRCWEYIDKNLIDNENGEWFNSVSASGEIYRRADKAGFWKCPYHNGRMCLEVIRHQASGKRQPKI